MSTLRGTKYVTTPEGQTFYNFLGEHTRRPWKRQYMTQADWAKEQILILAERGATQEDLLWYLAHVRDTIVDGTFLVSDNAAGQETCTTMTYAIEHLDSLLQNLCDRNLLKQTKGF